MQPLPLQLRLRLQRQYVALLDSHRSSRLCRVSSRESSARASRHNLASDVAVDPEEE